MSSILDDLKLQFRSGDVTIRLIFLNLALFVIPFVVVAILSMFGIRFDFLKYVSLSSFPEDLLWKPWSLITYAFFHAGIWHILFNLIMLNFSGRLFLTFFTQKQLLGLYIVSAIFAGIVYLFCYMFFPALSGLRVSMVGASGAVMAILFATTAYSPHMPLRLFLFGNVKLWHIATVLIIIDLIQLPAGNTGGHLAHLAGAFFGYFFIRQLKAGNDIVSWMSNALESVGDMFSGKRKKQPFKAVHRNPVKPSPKTTSRIVTKDKKQQQIDEILDKISKSGYDSLTKEEKDFLFRAGQQ